MYNVYAYLLVVRQNEKHDNGNREADEQCFFKSCQNGGFSFTCCDSLFRDFSSLVRCWVSPLPLLAVIIYRESSA